MKQIFYRNLVLITILFWCFSISAIEIGRLTYRLNNDGTATVVKGYKTSYTGDIVIPSTIQYLGETYSVTSIDQNAFDSCDQITSIVIPESVISIGNDAFYGCKGLKKAEFAHVASMCSINYGNKDSNPLFYAHNLWLADCEIKDLIIPDSVTIIKQYAFIGGNGLISVKMPNSVMSVEESAFEECSRLKNVYIEDGETAIKFGCHVFPNSPIETLYLGRNYDSSKIYNYLYLPFNRKTSLHSLSIGKSVTSIGDYAFFGCSSLTSINIPKSINSVGLSAFENCVGLTKVDFPSIEAMCKISYGNKYSNPLCYAHDFWIDGQEVKNLIIPNSITSIGSFAFYGCSGLTSIEIPESVTSVGPSAFIGCSGLSKAEFVSIEAMCKIKFGDSYSNPLYYANDLWVAGNNIKNLEIPNSVTSIGSNAFIGCSNLTSIEISKSVTSIGSNAFCGCEGLCTLVIPNSVVTIGDSAFYNCSSLSSVIIPNLVKEVGNNTFKDCNGLIKCAYPKTIQSPFENCVSISYDPEGVVFDNDWIIGPNRDIIYFAPLNIEGDYETENSITSIGAKAFYGCNGLVSLKILSKVSSVGESAFENCERLKNVYIEEGDTSLKFGDKVFANSPIEILYLGRDYTYINGKSDSPFHGKASLISLSFGNSVSSIGDSAFSGCSSLSSVEIPNSVSVIGSSAFFGCIGLTSVLISSSFISIGKDAFRDCSSLTKAEFLSIESMCNLKYENQYSNPLCYAHHLWIEGKEITNLEIPSSVIFIGSFAFYGCSYLTSIIITNAATTIGKSAFDNCDNLIKTAYPKTIESPFETGISIAYDPEETVIEDGWIFGSNINTIYYAPLNLGGAYEIPNIVTIIGKNAFYGCTGLISIEIPNSVQSIEEDAFRRCSGIKEVNIADGESTLEFGPSVFYDVPFEMLYLGRDFVCTSNNSSYQPFRDKKSLVSLTIGNSVTSIDRYTFSGCSGINSVVIPTSVIFIGEKAFYNCSGLGSVIIPNSVKLIGGDAFSSCDSLIKSASPRTMKYPFEKGICIYYDPEGAIIEDGWIYGPNKNTIYFAPLNIKGDYEIPNSVTSIGEAAFYGCDNLTSVKLSTSMIEIAKSTFSSCKTLASVNIPDPIQIIGDGAFDGCLSLKSVTLPGSIREIGEFAFRRCIELKNVIIINPIPPVIESSSFTDISSSSLFVPDGSRNVYSIHPYWGKFQIINTWGGTNSDETIFSYDSLSYRVTSKVDFTVEVMSASLVGNQTEIVIPTNVEYSGNLFRITGIANGCFQYVPLSSVTIPATIGYIGLESFKGCNGLRTIRCLAQTPPSICENAFDEDTYKETILEVPENLLSVYKIDGVWGKFSVRNIPVPILAIDIDPLEWIGKVGDDFIITTTVYPENATEESLIFTSSDETVVIVNAEGYVKAIGIGRAIIHIQSSRNPDIYAECFVTVEPKLVESLTIDPTHWSGEEGSEFTINATVLPQDASNPTLSFESSDPSVASVDSEGNVKLLKEGTCLIIVLTTDGSNLRAECAVTSISGVEAIFAGDTQLDVYDKNGVLVKRACTHEDLKLLTPDIYIIRNGKNVMKVVIR